jgi:F-type H+-transporting ATPase subunit delta
MATVSIARRYARALIDLGAEKNALDRYSQQLDRLVAAMGEAPELGEVLVNPAYGKALRAQVVEAVLAGLGGFDADVQNFVRLLLERGRLTQLSDIARVYRTLADARAGRVRGKVTSAVPLSNDALQKIEGVFRAVTQKEVVMESRVDPSILGGVSAEVGPLVYDGSIRSQLEELRRTLRSA